MAVTQEDSEVVDGGLYMRIVEVVLDSRETGGSDRFGFADCDAVFKVGAMDRRRVATAP
jgi:hypothetical protein